MPSMLILVGLLIAMMLFLFIVDLLSSLGSKHISTGVEGRKEKSEEKDI